MTTNVGDFSRFRSSTDYELPEGPFDPPLYVAPLDVLNSIPPSWLWAHLREVGGRRKLLPSDFTREIAVGFDGISLSRVRSINAFLRFRAARV